NCMEIFLTNDDGIEAKGLDVLAQFLRRYGNVTVIAPETEQSAKATSITLMRILRLQFIHDEPAIGHLGSLRKFYLDGTPVDCAKMGVNLFKEEGRMPDILASGINRGSNASAASIYSGTLGAAQEGTLYEIPSIGFSICSYRPDAYLETVTSYSTQIMDAFLANPPAKGTYLNVNFPDIPPKDVKGIRFAHQGAGRWIKEFEKHTDPRGRDFYWMVGEFENLDSSKNADHLLIDKGYITIVPHKIDTTNYEEKERLEKLWKL
ncbi:MAG: 5'/3'-nucleotidase SurE, partial [Bacteroidales bacterium]|nr:5'/3'-nucleotidase SurE [Bacteroidales bacterium]